MLNNFCFHVYAQKSLFIAENCNGFFFDILILFTLSCDFRVHRAGSQLKINFKSLPHTESTFGKWGYYPILAIFLAGNSHA